MEIFADIIMINGHVLTLDNNDTRAQAIAVYQGKILKVGNTGDIKKLAGSETKEIDLQGKTVIPGFIDAHTHNDMYGMMTSDLVVDCHIPPLKSAEDILQSIKQRAASLPKGELILGQGGTFQPYPTKKELDEISPDHPVIIKPSMHWYLLNSQALERFNITAERPTFEELNEVDPCGYINRDSETGEPTGFVEECWNYMFPRSKSPFTYEHTKRMVKEGLDLHSSYGVTSLVEFMDFPESPKIYSELYKEGALNIRLQLIPCFYGLYKTVDFDEIIHAGLTTGFGDEWLKFGGVKIFVDRQQDTSCSSARTQRVVFPCAPQWPAGVHARHHP